MTPERLARIKRANEIDNCGVPKSMANDLIAHAEQTMWRSVEDGLPEVLPRDDERCWQRVWNNNALGGELHGRWDGRCWMCSDGYKIDGVTHWMPITPPEDK